VFRYFPLLLSPFLLLTFFPRLSPSLFLLIQLTFILLPFGLLLRQLLHFKLLYIYIFFFVTFFILATLLLSCLQYPERPQKLDRVKSYNFFGNNEINNARSNLCS